MIAYNTDWLDALLTQDAARDWHEKGLISDEKWQAVRARHKANFYSPNVFVRIGLAIFCYILLLAAAGIVGMAVEPNSETGFALYCLFWGGVCFFVLERWAIRSARHRASGIDDVLLYTGIGAVVGGLIALFDGPEPLVCCLIALPFLVWGSIRYADRLVAAASFGCVLLLILLMVNEILPSLALYLLPFVGMAFSAAAYFFAQQGQGRWAWRHWHGPLGVVELLALVTFYASGNYWVVQQTGTEMFELEWAPMGWFFWAFTFAVPVAYIVWGLRSKNRHLLDVGLGCVVAAIFSFRYYHHVMPLAWAAVLGGAVMFATAYLTIRFLRKNASPYTYEQDAEASLLQEIEQQLVEQGIGGPNAPATATKPESLGGGQFGGGGAGGEF